MEAQHTSVLTKEVLEALAVKPSDTVVDATIGGAGHFSMLLAALGEGGTLIGIDADPAALERGREAYATDRRSNRPVAHIINDNFRNLAHIVERLHVGKVNAILFDLGWSGYQIASPRGFSFQNNEPLLMTYGEGVVTAAEFINSASETELTRVIREYGEERYARGIAHAITKARTKERILTTDALVAAVLAGTPRRSHQGKIHPATKTFQAIRIVVNDELNALREALSAALAALAPKGRLAIITFHSLEDRLVKQAFRRATDEGLGLLLYKKPRSPSRSEILLNRRARSAKLRVFEKAHLYTDTPWTHEVHSVSETISYA